VTLALATATCGRTGLDEPVDVTGGAGSAAGSAGSAGTIGQAGTTGQAGNFGPAGTTGADAAAGTAAEMCVPGTAECDGPNVARLCVDGVWGDAFMCPMGCVNGVCAECMPGTASCPSSQSIQVCSAIGILLPMEPCPAGCTAGVCGAAACADGETRCVASGTEQICKNGAWSDPVDCPFVCVGNACGERPRKVFVTSETFVGGNLGGLTGADDICRKLAVSAGLSSSYAAWLSDSTGSPVTRFPEDVGPYLLVNGAIVANNWTDLTSGTLRQPIDLTELGGPPPLGTVGCVNPAVWSGTQNNGVLPQERGDCDDWSSTTSETAVFGSVFSTTMWSDACTLISGTPAKACGGSSALYCFEQ
jgi:hypothetical protein